jgi:predicted SAM-dependent methyltransferase
MIIVKPKHVSKLPIDLWSRHARVVVCEDYTKCIEPGRVVLFDDTEPIIKPPNVVFVDINKPCINIGSGTTNIDGCLNLDVRQLPNVDFVVDLEKAELPFPDNFFATIYAIDVIEHITYRKVKQLIKELHRVLDKGGRLVVRSPDMELIARYVLDRRFPGVHGDLFETMSWYIYGEQDYPENVHKSAFTKETLKQLLEGAGFVVVTMHNETGHPNIYAEAIKR